MVDMEQMDLELRSNRVASAAKTLAAVASGSQTSQQPSQVFLSSSWLPAQRWEKSLVLPTHKGGPMATLGPRPGNVAKPPENQAKILKWTRALNKKSVHFQEEDAVLNAITLPKKEVPVEPQQGLVAVEGSSGIAEENKADEHMHAEDDEAGEKERAQSKSEALDVSHASVNGNGNGSGEDAFGHSEAASALAGLAGPSEDGGGTPAAEQENSSDHGEDDADLDGMDVDEPQ